MQKSLDMRNVYRYTFRTMLWELCFIDTDPIYKGIFSNNIYELLKDAIIYLSMDDCLIIPYQVNIILDEFNYLVDKDVVFNTSHFRYKSNLLIKEIRKNAEEKDYIKLKQNFEILLSNLEAKDCDLDSMDTEGNKHSYEKVLINKLNSFLDPDFFDNTISKWMGEEKSIKQLKKLIFIFFSLLKNKKNYSRKYLEDYIKNILDNSKLKIEDDSAFKLAYRKITKLLFSKEKSFDLYFKIEIGKQANIKKKNIEDFQKIFENLGVSIMGKEEINLSILKYKDCYKKQINSFLNLLQEQFIVKISWIKGYDLFMSFLKAQDILNGKLDILNFEFNALTVKINESALSISNNNLFFIDRSKREFYNRNFGSETRLNNLITILNKNSLHWDVKNKIRNSLSYYRLFLDSHNLESKFLNLWIAFESLFSDIHETNDPKFTNIRKYTASIISMNMLKYLFDEFRAFLLFKQSKEKERYSYTQKYSQIITEIITNNQKHRNHSNLNVVAILNFLQDVGLERERGNMKNDSFFYKYLKLEKLTKIKDGKYEKLYEYLWIIEKKANWLITKLYRYRNYIVHGWDKLANNYEIIYELEFIFLFILKDITEKLSQKNIGIVTIKSLSEYFEKMDRSYKHYKSWLTSSMKNEHLVLPRIVY